ncbi:MAG TPA: hypothetical protein VKZ63_18485 [Kofleriaceae bacterium]|nr:hypothetical protein [Kofleriaceae bacterium]
MTTRFRTILSRALAPLALAALLGACGGDDGGGSGDGTGDPDGGSDTDPDAGPDADGFAPLLTVDWTLPPPSGPNPDRYWCAALTVEEDVIITGFRDISPPGTHHAVLSVGAGGGADNPGFECNVASNHDALLFASGVGTDDFVFPDGVGIRVAAGQQLFLNLHLFNTSEQTITGTSGVAVRTVDAVETEAEFTFAGTFLLDIPAGSTGHEESGSCPVAQDGTILNWWPHMHQLGRHMTIQVNDQIVHDQPYAFTEQKNYPTELAVSAGDTITVTCTYDNPTGMDVGWGDSSNQEMCFAGFYRYPKVGQAFCADGGSF